MTAPLSDPYSGGPCLRALIQSALARRGDRLMPALDDGERAIAFDRLVGRTWVEAAPGGLQDKSLLLLTRRPLNAALALCALDGAARRLVICPPDLALDQLPYVLADAEIEAVVHDLDEDREGLIALPDGLPAFPIRQTEDGYDRPVLAAGRTTEWALFTSGTTGPPKMVVHTLAGLTGAIASAPEREGARFVWATFYDIRRYGGLQMLLRALTGGHAMQLTGPDEPMAAFLPRLATAGVTHLAGTPSHWRGALMHTGLERLSPSYVRLSGEIADQPLLDRLAARFPGAVVSHAYASTEAGVGFEVNDGMEGFPAAYLDRTGPVEMRVEAGTLRLRSSRTARAYLGLKPPVLADASGFVDTGDLVEQRGERFYFMGRASGVINVGGLKVHPAEVEAVLNRCEGVRMALVKSRRNPIVGAIVAAEVVLADPAQGLGEAGRETRARILDHCRAHLAAHKVPASIVFKDELPISPGGKVERRDA